MCLEWRSQGGHFVCEAAERPNITLLVVLLLVDLLGTHVVRGAHVGLGIHGAVVEHARQSKIAQLGILVRVKKDVSWLQISMQNSLRSSRLCCLILLLVTLLLSSIDHGGLGAPMAVEEAGDDLSEDFPNEILEHVFLSLNAALDYVLEVATLAKLHYYKNFQVAFVNAAFIKAHNIRMLEVSQDINLCNDLLFLFVVHFAII